MKSFRSITAVLASSALVAGAAAPVAMAQTPATYPGDSQTHRPGKKGKKKPRKLTDAQLTTVASALGTTLDALKAAMASVKAATDATEVKETKAQKDALLAAELDVTVAQLRAAFGSVRGSTDGTCKPRPSGGTYPTDSAA